MNTLFVYTREQAIADGVLVRLEDYLTQHGLAGQPIAGALRDSDKNRFPLGELIITKTATLELPPKIVVHYLIRHSLGDWGELCGEDRELNECGLDGSDRLFSVYCPKRHPKFYIITECNREATTVLLPGDY
jgi:hypothetical protein